MINSDGLVGSSYVNEKDGLLVEVSSPLTKNLGTNPEQLFGLALVTCLNATIEAEEKRRGLTHQAIVVAVVELHPDTEGYQIVVEVNITIPHVSRVTAEEIVTIARRRCPMVKLIGQSPNVTSYLV